MDATHCWRCQFPVAPTAPATGLCGYCGAVLGRPPNTRWRWAAHPPAGRPRPTRPGRRGPYAGPPRYRGVPRWGFPPSVWVPTPAASPAAEPVSPARDLRSVVVLARTTAVMCLVAAAAEAFRYLLLVRGRTEVLPAAQVRWSDALVLAAGWGAPLLALATAAAFVRAVSRTGAWAGWRAQLRPARSPARRSLWLLAPGWNLYGAGVVVSEIDAVLRLGAPVRPGVARPDRLRWRSAGLPTVPLPAATGDTSATVASATAATGTAATGAAATGSAAAGPAAAEAAEPAPVHRSPHRRVAWWWASWAAGGLLTLITWVWSVDPGSLQARANLVELHVVVDLVAAVCAFLTAAVARSWHRLVAPDPVTWPVGWVMRPQEQGGVPATSVRS